MLGTVCLRNFFFYSNPAFCPQHAVLAKPGCATETVTVRTTLMRTTVKRWCVSSPTMCVPTTPPSACLQRNFAMALMTAQMARMRNSVVRDNSTQTALQYRENFNSKQNSASLNQGFSCSTALCSYSLCQSSDSLYSTDLCSLDNGDCSHNCTVAPGEGVICSCPLGMELGPDNKTCQIQSFCAKHLKCSQRCEQDKFSAKCSCYEGWELEPDMENCKSTGKGVKWHGGGGGSQKTAVKSLNVLMLAGQ